jgi:Flp pilus assembly protein TadD/predicted AlkP superfamily phosphohydrolase/phosphomutase
LTDRVADHGKRRRWGTAIVVVGVALALWLASGLRQSAPGSEIGVLDGPIPGLFPMRVERAWVIAPPGLARLTRYPAGAVEIELPSDAQARIAGPDGSRYALKGTATLRVRPEQWREAHSAAGGAGLAGVLAAALPSSGVPLPTRWDRRAPIPPTVERQFRERLKTELKRRGVELRGLSISGLEPLVIEAGADSPPPLATRMLVIGLDGADWEILDPLLEQGRMPHLESLIRRGTRAKLLSISPMLSPVVWTTVATGVEPSRHGILDFLVPDSSGGPGEPVTSAHRKAATLWQILSRVGVRVGVVGWWASWPAEPVSGYMVSDRVAYQLFGYRSDAEAEEGKVWPPELYPRVRSAIVPPEAIEWEEVLAYLDGDRSQPDEFSETESGILEEFRTLLAAGRTYLDIATTLAADDPPQMEAVYFEGTDTVGHLFMRFRPPRLPAVDERTFDSFRNVVDRYYETVDGYLGEILEGRGQDWTVMVLSDHGFLTGANRPRTSDPRIGHGPAADWHRRFGVLVLSGRHVQPGVELSEATVYDIAPTLLALFGQPVPASWPGMVLASALTPEFIEEHPVRYRSDDPPLSDGSGQGGTAPHDPAAREVLEKLESLGYIGTAHDDAPRSLTNRNNAGVALMAEGRYAEAEVEFRAALEEQARHPAVTVNLALVLRMQGRTEEARELLLSALEFDGSRRAAGHHLGAMAYEAGDLDEAEKRLREVLRWEPDAADVLTTLGLVLDAKGESEAAEAAYRRAADLDPGAAIARNNLGNLARRDRRLEEAEAWYRRSIEADPYFMGAYNNLALVYQEQGKIDAAIELYEQARGRSPGNAVVLNNLASLYYATGDLDEARLLWEQAVRFDPGYPSPFNNLAGIAISEGRYEDAEQLLAMALKLNEDYGDARINLALVHEARERWDDARRELDLALRDPVARVNARTQLGILDLRQGRPVDAVEHLLEASELSPRNTTALNALGEAYRQLGLTEQAIDAWSRSLSLDPSQTPIQQSLDELRGR